MFDGLMVYIQDQNYTPGNMQPWTTAIITITEIGKNKGIENVKNKKNDFLGELKCKSTSLQVLGY